MTYLTGIDTIQEEACSTVAPWGSGPTLTLEVNGALEDIATAGNDTVNGSVEALNG